MVIMDAVTWANGFIALNLALMGWTAKSVVTLTKAQVEVQTWIKSREAVCNSHERRIERTEAKLME